MKNDSGLEEDRTLKAEEFMKIIKVSPNTFKKLVSEGRIPAPLPLGTRVRRWSRSVVMQFLNQPDKDNKNNNTQI